MHDPGNIAEEREQDVQPEVSSEADLQEDAQRRQQDRQDDANEIHASAPRFAGPRGRPAVGTAGPPGVFQVGATIGRLWTRLPPIPAAPRPTPRRGPVRRAAAHMALNTK